MYKNMSKLYINTTPFHLCLNYLNNLVGVDVEHTVAKCVMSKDHLNIIIGFNSTEQCFQLLIN